MEAELTVCEWRLKCAWRRRDFCNLTVYRGYFYFLLGAHYWSSTYADCTA